MRREYLKIVRSAIDKKLQDGGSEPVSMYRECQKILAGAIEEIKKDLQGKPFRSIAEEIAFYKEEAPNVLGLYFFYTALVKIEAARKYESPENFRAGLEHKLEKTETFFKKYRSVCAYYYEGRTNNDERLFTRRTNHDGKNPVAAILTDRTFTYGAKWLSLMRRNELLRAWLNSALKAASGDKSQRKLKYYGSQTGLLEVLKAMHLNGDFGDVTFEYVVACATEVFGIDINNHENTLDNMKNRKENAVHLMKLIKILKEFFEMKKPPKSRERSYLG